MILRNLILMLVYGKFLVAGNDVLVESALSCAHPLQLRETMATGNRTWILSHRSTSGQDVICSHLATSDGIRMCACMCETSLNGLVSDEISWLIPSHRKCGNLSDSDRSKVYCYDLVTTDGNRMCNCTCSTVSVRGDVIALSTEKPKKVNQNLMKEAEQGGVILEVEEVQTSTTVVPEDQSRDVASEQSDLLAEPIANKLDTSPSGNNSQDQNLISGLANQNGSSRMMQTLDFELSTTKIASDKAELSTTGIASDKAEDLKASTEAAHLPENAEAISVNMVSSSSFTDRNYVTKSPIENLTENVTTVRTSDVSNSPSIKVDKMKELMDHLVENYFLKSEEPSAASTAIEHIMNQMNIEQASLEAASKSILTYPNKTSEVHESIISVPTGDKREEIEIKGFSDPITTNPSIGFQNISITLPYPLKSKVDRDSESTVPGNSQHDSAFKDSMKMENEAKTTATTGLSVREGKEFRFKETSKSSEEIPTVLTNSNPEIAEAVEGSLQAEVKTAIESAAIVPTPTLTPSRVDYPGNVDMGKLSPIVEADFKNSSDDSLKQNSSDLADSITLTETDAQEPSEPEPTGGPQKETITILSVLYQPPADALPLLNETNSSDTTSNQIDPIYSSEALRSLEGDHQNYQFDSVRSSGFSQQDNIVVEDNLIVVYPVHVTRKPYLKPKQANQLREGGSIEPHISTRAAQKKENGIMYIFAEPTTEPEEVPTTEAPRILTTSVKPKLLENVDSTEDLEELNDIAPTGEEDDFSESDSDDDSGHKGDNDENVTIAYSSKVFQTVPTVIPSSSDVSTVANNLDTDTTSDQPSTTTLQTLTSSHFPIFTQISTSTQFSQESSTEPSTTVSSPVFVPSLLSRVQSASKRRRIPIRPSTTTEYPVETTLSPSNQSNNLIKAIISPAELKLRRRNQYSEFLKNRAREGKPSVITPNRKPFIPAVDARQKLLGDAKRRVNFLKSRGNKKQTDSDQSNEAEETESKTDAEVVNDPGRTTMRPVNQSENLHRIISPFRPLRARPTKVPLVVTTIA